MGSNWDMFSLATKLKPSRTSLELARNCGYAAAEFWTNQKSLRQWSEISAIARQVDLKYVIHFPNKAKLDTDDLRCAAALYRELDCRAMVIHQPMFEAYGASLLSIEPTLRLGIENHRLDRKAFEAWADRCSWLTLDVEHLWMYTLAGESLSTLERTLETFLGKYASKLVHVHLPGHLAGYGEHRPMYCSREMVMMTFTLLEEADYDGLVVGELDPEYQNEAELKMDALLYQRWRQLRGLSANGTAESSSERNGVRGL
jgi:hypothetical protein